MKTKYRFEIMELDDGLVAVPVGAGAEQFQGVLKLNETAKSIIELLENETTEDIYGYTIDYKTILTIPSNNIDSFYSNFNFLYGKGSDIIFCSMEYSEAYMKLNKK